MEVVGQRAADGGGALLHRLKALLQASLGLVVRAHPPVAVGAGRLERQRAVGGDVDRHRMADVDEARVGMQEADVGALASLGAVSQRIVDFLAVQQRAQHAQVFAEGAGLDRVLAHDTHRGVAGADAQEGAAGRQLVDGGDRMRGDRRQPHAGHRHAGAEPDARSVGRRQRQHGVGIGIEHLQIGRPGGVVAHRLEIDEQPPVRYARDDRDSEFHGVLPGNDRFS